MDQSFKELIDILEKLKRAEYDERDESYNFGIDSCISEIEEYRKTHNLQINSSNLEQDTEQER